MSEEKKKASSVAAKKALSTVSRFPLRTKLIILAVIAVLFSFSFPIISNIVGRSFGSTVGIAVGSFQAVTEDMPAAYHQGREDGLSAEDTRAELQDRLTEVGRLDVLVATAKITDPHLVGNNYAALWEFGADVIFSVDISKAQVRTGEGTIEVILPEPVAEINIDSTKTRLLDVWQRGRTGDAKKGMDAFFNSLEKIELKGNEAIDNYEGLKNRARQSAEDEVMMLVRLSADEGTQIEIRFEEMGGENNV